MDSDKWEKFKKEIEEHKNRFYLIGSDYSLERLAVEEEQKSTKDENQSI